MNTNTVRTADITQATSVEISIQDPTAPEVATSLQTFKDRVFGALGEHDGKFSIKDGGSAVIIEGFRGEKITPFAGMIGALKTDLAERIEVTMYSTTSSDPEALFSNSTEA